MDIDTQDDLLVEYDDGDDAMPDADAEADAEMADEEQDGDTPMVDDIADPFVRVMTGEILVEEEEIDMRPAEEEDTPMREDGDESRVEDADERIEADESRIDADAEEPASWPPAPTDVPPVPSLLPSALAVPPAAQHEEGKIHDRGPTGAESVVADPAVDQQVEPLDDDDDVPRAASERVEPALSVRGSDGGTFTTNEERLPGTTATAPPSVGADQDDAQWPPAPTEVPPVPSLLPSALAVPDAGEPSGGERRERREESVRAEPAGSVLRGAGEHQSPEEKVGAESVDDVPSVIGDSSTDDHTVPLVLVINETSHQPLFAPLPSGMRYDASKTLGQPLLAGMAVDVFRAPLSEVFQALRDALAERDDEFSVKRGKELVLDVPALQLSVGEDNKYAGEITLHDLVQLFRDCNAVPPMVLRVVHDHPRFIEKYKMIRAMVDAQRGEHEVDDEAEYDDGDGDELQGADEGEESPDVDEGETVYVDAHEDQDLAVDVDEYDFDDEDHQPYEPAGEEDELAQDTSDPQVPRDDDKPTDPPARGATDEIVEYEEEQVVVVDAPAGTIDLTDDLDAPETDQFGVEATIRAAEQQSAIGAVGNDDGGEAEERTTAGKRAREVEDGREPGQAERQVKRKLSEASDAAAPVGDREVIPDAGEERGEIV